MPTAGDIQTSRELLQTWRRSLEKRFADAQAVNDSAEMTRLTGVAKDIDELLDELAFLGLGQVAASLTEIKERIEGHHAAVTAAGSLLGGASLSEIRKALDEIFAETSEEPVPDAPAPEPQAVAAPPDGGAPAVVVAPVLDAGAASAAAAGPSAADPGAGAEGRLILTEAHLIALWKRSQFPIDGRGVIVFGLRGCRPVDFSGTDFLAQQEIAMRPVNYRTMNCTIGQWRPGHGIALFPGSTVPFGVTVANAVANGGAGVNRMGRGRYLNYVAGWHKRSEGPNGHWALLQETPITLQRTADDAEFDPRDRWEVGRVAGDNIHCAFHMGEDAGIPDVPFSSAGCQTVAGMVKKGVRDSERGPWRRFIATFSRDLGSQKSTEYVLFDGDEVQQIIRTRYKDKSIILRMGSAGPWVADLQAGLIARSGAHIKVTGQFDAPTFQAVIDFQSRTSGDKTADGVVGTATAGALGVTLPAFDFDDAISGGPGYFPPRAPVAPVTTPPEATAQPAAAAPQAPAAPAVAAATPTTPISWGAVVIQKHGQPFKAKAIEICRRLGCDPNHLMAVMAFETGESFAPDQKSKSGSGATGLIQFMRPTAVGLGTTIEALAAMKAIDQLDFVEKHFRSVAHGRALPALSDVYMAVLLPSAIGKLDGQVLFQAPSKAFDQNKGLDVNKDGRITKAEATAKVQAKLVLGMKAERFG